VKACYSTLVVALFCACRARGGESTDAATVVRSTVRTRDATVAPRGTVCDDIMAEGAAAVAVWRRHTPTLADAAAPPWEAVEALNHCEADDNGSWATVVEPPTRDSVAGHPAGRFKIVHVSPVGARFESFPALEESGERFTLRPHETNWVADVHGLTTMGAWTRFDFDGDLVSEVVIPVTERTEERGEQTYLLVWKAAQGHLEAYAPAMGLHPVALEDFDHDGRPDLRTYADLVGVFGSPTGTDITLHGPRLLARSMPDGTFETSRGEALTANRALCPMGATGLVVARDREQSAHHVACAALWHVPRSTLMNSVVRECHGTTPEDCPTWKPGLLAMVAAVPQADLRVSLRFDLVSPEMAFMADAPPTQSHVTVVIEGAPNPFSLDQGMLQNPCEPMNPNAHEFQVGGLRCADDTLRVVRRGPLLVTQRRSSHATPLIPWRDVGRMPLEPTVPIRVEE
jgi:hypothetical protein